jgi:hypothetical protein
MERPVDRDLFFQSKFLFLKIFKLTKVKEQDTETTISF